MATEVATTTGIVKDMLPKFGAFGANAMDFFTWLIILVLVIVGCSISIYFVIRYMKYNKRIEIYEKVDGKFRRTRIDKAMEVRFSTAGDTIFYLRKHKKYLPNPRIQTGARTYWYFIREDGEWLNFGIEDLDEAMRELKAHFLDKEIRYARTQVQKGLKERYEKVNFFAKHAVMIMSISFIVLIGVLTFLLFDKWIDLAQVTNNGVEMAGKVMDKIDVTMGKLDSICVGGSGYKPAT